MFDSCMGIKSCDVCDLVVSKQYDQSLQKVPFAGACAAKHHLPDPQDDSWPVQDLRSRGSRHPRHSYPQSGPLRCHLPSERRLTGVPI